MDDYEKALTFYDEPCLTVGDLYNGNLTDATSIDDNELYGFMTKDQIAYIRKQNAKYKVQNIIYADEELENILKDISGSMRSVDESDKSLDYFNDLTRGAYKSTSDNIVYVKIPNGILWDGTIPISSLRWISPIDEVINICDGVCKHRTGNMTLDIRIYEDIIDKYVYDPSNDYEEIILIGSIDCRLSHDNPGIIGFENVIIPLVTSVKRHTVELDLQHIYISKNYITNMRNWTRSFEEYRDNIFDLSEDIASECLYNMVYWHGVQLALLNPAIKLCMNTSARVPLETGMKSNNRGINNKPVKYVRKIVINTTKIKDVLYKKDAHGNYTRKTLIWYVVGHWYTRNGKRFFQRGHWKGILRNNPEYTGEPRERELAFNDEHE